VALRSHFFLLAVPKYVLDDFENGIIQWVGLAYEHIFCLMTDPKCELGEVEKAMFPGIGRL
jgi:hypothetical protein